MRTFLKANMASLMATASDYAVTVLLKEVFKLHVLVSGITGTVTGGIVNFFVCRHWVFKAGDEHVYTQGKKFALTWTGNLILNSAGYYFLINFTDINYVVAKLITSVTVALAYNYPLQKKYVFKNI